MKCLNKLLIIYILFAVGCVHAPPELSPDAKAAFNKTRVIKVLDVLRDFVIAAEDQTPKLVSTNEARKVVEWHRSSLRIIDSISNGWQVTVEASLDELAKNLPPNEQRLLGPYIILIRAVIEETQR